jgi:hypothetical protein
MPSCRVYPRMSETTSTGQNSILGCVEPRAVRRSDYRGAEQDLVARVPADAFARQFAPAAIQKGRTSSWRPADDVYQIGCLYVALLCGSAEPRVTTRRVKSLACSPEAKSVIQRSIGDRRKRFADSREMLARLERQESQATLGSRVRTLKGKRVVFTGGMAMPRAEAKRLVRRAGGTAEDRVSHRTDVVVVGEQSPHWKAEKKGQKLLDVEYEREVGHPIALINERHFLALSRAKPDRAAKKHNGGAS